MISHNNDIVTHQESDYDSDTETHHMSRKHNVIRQKTKTRLIFNISQGEIKELHCPVLADESQIKEVSIEYCFSKLLSYFKIKTGFNSYFQNIIQRSVKQLQIIIQ